MNTFKQLFSAFDRIGAGWSDVTSGKRNEIVFERLNKTYGAYEIRTHYDRTLLKAFSGAGLLIVLLSASTFFSNSKPVKKIPPPIVDSTIFKPWEEKKPDLPDDPPASSPEKDDLKDLIPEVEKDSVPDLDTTTLLVLLTNPSNGNNRDTGSVTPTGPTGGGKGTDPVEKPDPIFDGIFLSEKPEFPGGELPMRQFLQKNTIYPEYTKEIGGKGVVNVGFIVDKEGNITDVTVLNACKFPELNNEAVRVIKKMPQWLPGRQQGNPVKVRMNLPIRFDLKQ